MKQAAESPVLSQLLPTRIGYFPQAKGHHCHRPKGTNEHVLIYCTEGQGAGQVTGWPFVTLPNQLLWLPADIPHAYHADPKKPWSIYWIHLQGPLADHYAELLDISPMHPIVPLPNLPELVNQFEEIRQLALMGDTMSNLRLIAANMHRWLATAERYKHIRRWRSQTAAENVQATIEYMQQHLDQAIRMDDLAKRAHLSTRHYREIFSKLTGQSPIQYFLQLRIQEACRLLSHSDMAIQEIARNVGFEEPCYFSRMFRQNMKMSPMQYRQNTT